MSHEGGGASGREAPRLLLVFFCLGLEAPRPAEAIRGMCAAAQFFNYQSEFFNDLCWVELEMNCDVPPGEENFPY